MKESKDKNKSVEIENPDREAMEDLDLFIEKRRIQNEALKKIVEMNTPSQENNKHKKNTD